MTWEKIKLGKILTESKIISKNPDSSKRIRIRLNLKGIEKRPETNDKTGATRYYSRKVNQFIYGKQNLFKGAFGIVPKELDGFESSSDLPAFDIDSSCNPEWIFYFLKQGNFYETLINISTGTGSRRIQPKKLYELEIPLPSIEEQNKLIEKFKLNGNKFDLIVGEFKEQQTYLTKLKEAILQEAVQGKLVEQNPEDEPASILLEKIKKERSHSLNSFGGLSKTTKGQLIKEKKIKKEKPLSEIKQDEIPYELPKGWEWVRLGKITNFGSTKKIESNDILPETWLLDLEDIEKTTSKLLRKKVFNESPSKSSKNIFEKEDVLYSKLRPYLDKVLLATESGVCTSEILPIRGYLGIESKYLRYYLKNPIFLKYVNELTYGIKMPRLGTIDGKKSLFPLPPSEEQKRIVEKVDTLMTYCDELEQEINNSKKQAEKLMQSVLKEAFEEKEVLLVKN